MEISIIIQFNAVCFICVNIFIFLKFTYFVIHLLLQLYNLDLCVIYVHILLLIICIFSFSCHITSVAQICILRAGLPLRNYSFTHQLGLVRPVKVRFNSNTAEVCTLRVLSTCYFHNFLTVCAAGDRDKAERISGYERHWWPWSDEPSFRHHRTWNIYL